MSEPSHRLRLPKLQKKNLSESNISHLGAEPVRSEDDRPASSTPSSPRLRPGFFNKVTGLFKGSDKVYLAFVLRDEVANLTGSTLF